ADLEVVDVLARRPELGDRLVVGVLVVLVLGKLEQHAGVLKPLAQAFQPAKLPLKVGQPPGNALRARLVLPEGRVGGLLTQVGDLSAHRLRIDYGLDGVELGRQFRYLIGGIGSCDAGKPTRIRARQRIQGSPGRSAGGSSPGYSRVSWASERAGRARTWAGRALSGCSRSRRRWPPRHPLRRARPLPRAPVRAAPARPPPSPRPRPAGSSTASSPRPTRSHRVPGRRCSRWPPGSSARCCPPRSGATASSSVAARRARRALGARTAARSASSPAWAVTPTARPRTTCRRRAATRASSSLPSRGRCSA